MTVKIAPPLEPRHEGPYYGYELRRVVDPTFFGEPNPPLRWSRFAAWLVVVSAVGACVFAALENL